jgi:MFS family permease
MSDVAGRRVEVGATTGRERWVALYVLCVGMLMIVLDVTVVNVALPSIQDDLRFSTSSLAWVVNAYLIAFGGLLLLAGRLGDLIEQPHAGASSSPAWGCSPPHRWRAASPTASRC